MSIESEKSRIDYRQRARFGVSHHDEELAERSYEQVLAISPDDLEALQYLAVRSLAKNNPRRAVELLVRANLGHPSHPAILHQLGAAQLADGDALSAVESLKSALKLAPDLFVARLRLGVAFEQVERPDDALVSYFAAINLAQSKNRWLSDETTAPKLRETVKRAMGCVDAGRRDLFERSLEPLRQRYGRSELARVEQCLAIYLGDRAASISDTRQKPKFLHFPNIPAQPYYARSRFPWIPALEAGTADIREELFSVLSQANSLESFLQTEPSQDTFVLLKSSSNQDPAWNAYFFHRHGKRFDDHYLKCPQTAALLDSLPLTYVREHSPETLFSVLSPGTHILPHHGVTNTRLVTHLPLIVPPDCALRVGGETHVWEEGRCVTFDDTFEHEAWNKSAETRVVLIVDSWNPDLSEAERAALADLVGAIGDFNRACELPAQN